MAPGSFLSDSDFPRHFLKVVFRALSPTLGMRAIRREGNSARAASGGNSFLPAPLGFFLWVKIRGSENSDCILLENIFG